MDAFLASWVVAGCILGAAQPAAAQPATVAPDRVEALIRQLGDSSFAKREAATKALVAEGEKVVPFLDKARKGADLELGRRIDRIRYQLVGYQDDLTAFLSSPFYNDGEARPELPPDVRTLVSSQQPKSGDFLLKIIADQDHKLNRAATHLFCETWANGSAKHRSGDFLLKIIADQDHKLHRAATELYCETWSSGSVKQMQSYLEACFTLQAFHRTRYPEGVTAYIETRYWHRYGWSGWPKELVWQTRTTHFLDGQAYGKPFAYNYPGGGAATGWINVGKLAQGKHILRFEVEIEFTHKGAKHQTKVRSPEFAFTVGPAALPNDLVAATDGALNKLVREVLAIVEHCGPESDPLIFQGGGQRLRIDWWQPQITWEEQGKRRGLRVPEWTLTKKLPVDLCFEVTLRDVKSGKSHPGDPLVVKKGQTSLGYFSPRDARAFCKDRAGSDRAGFERDGFVEIEIDLQPSRALALTHPEITGYFGWPITSKVLRAKVIREIRAAEKQP